MKFYNSEKKELVAGSLQVNAEKQLVVKVSLGGGLEFEVFPIEIAMQNTKEGLEISVDVPNSGTDTLYMLLEYSDVKALTALPGKGLVSFGLKALR